MMRSIDLSTAAWRKSSYSGGEGGNCIEVADAVPVHTTWRKSSYSNSDGGNCIEVADGHPAAVPVRDSKAPHGPVLVFETAAWSSFVAGVRGEGFGRD